MSFIFNFGSHCLTTPAPGVFHFPKYFTLER